MHQAHLRVQVLFFSKLPVKKVKSFFFSVKKYNTKVWVSRKMCSHISIDPLFFLFFFSAIMNEHAHNSFPTWIIETSGIHSASNNENCTLAPQKSRLYPWKKENAVFFFTTSVGQKLLSTAPAQTKQTVFSTLWNHPLKAGRHVHVLYVLMDSWREGGGYDIVANWQQSIAIMDVKRPEGQVINSVGLMNERFISSLWHLCLYWTGNKAFEQMKSPPCPPDMSTA